MQGYPVRDEIFDKIKAFLNEIDKPGAVLAVYDEGQTFARKEILNYQRIYRKMFDYIFSETQHIKVRVGGYSHRVATMVDFIAQDNSSIKARIEYVSEYVKDILFDKESDFIKRVDEYDFKGFDGHSCVYYYVNNLDSGFTDEEGDFHQFYGARHKGLWAIEEVVMAIGYKNINPATAAIHTYSSDSSGDMLIIGGKATKKKSRGLSRQILFEEYNIPYLDIYKILPSIDVLWEDLEKEKKERQRIWLEEYVVKRQDGDFCMVFNQGKYMFKNGESFLLTPNSVVVNTRYLTIARMIYEDWKDKGYESHKDPTSILNYHFTCIDDFLYLNQKEAVEFVNKFNWEEHWSLNECPVSDSEEIKEWTSLFGNRQNRIAEIKSWLDKCSHMQLAAVTCIIRAYGSINLAYLMAALVEFGKNWTMKTEQIQLEKIRSVAEIAAKYDKTTDYSNIANVFLAFKGYYNVHFWEDGTKTLFQFQMWQ